MDAYRAIISKRDTREYEDTPIPEEVLLRILQAGRMAGSSKNEQPIRVVVVRDPDRKRELARCGDFTAHLPASPVVLVLVRREGSRPFDAGRVAQNMMVAAQAEGVASCPVALQHDDCTRDVLGLPADTIVAMTVTLGYPKNGRARGRGERRIPMDDFVRQEHW